MFIGTLLVVLCFIEAYLATANAQLTRDRSAELITTLLDRLTSEEQHLTTVFQTKPKPPDPPPSRLSGPAKQQNLYAETRKKLGLPPPLPPIPAKPPPKQLTYSETLDAMASELAKGSISRKEEFGKYINVTIPPSDLIRSLQREKERIENKPTTVWGIQTPRLLQVQYAGQDFKIPFGFLSGTLEIALGLLIIGWLGAFAMTRQRELIRISEAEDYKNVFPHLLNFLPVSFDKLNRRFNARYVPRAQAIVRAFNRITQAIYRSAVIILFTIPMVVGFMYSLAQLWEIESDGFSFLFISGAVLAVIMTIQSFMLFAQEWVFLHKKEFYE